MHVSVICTFGHRSAAAALFPVRGDFLASKRAQTAQAARQRTEGETRRRKSEGRGKVSRERIDMHVGEKCLVSVWDKEA